MSFAFLPAISTGFAQSVPSLTITGQGDLPSMFRVTDLAAESMGFAAAMLERYAADGNQPAAVMVDRRLASFWFDMTLRPQGWELPSLWGDLAGNYRTVDGWIRLHTNAPHHRAVAVAVLGANDREAVSRAVSRWQADALEQAIVDAGGCAAAMHSLADWDVHAQGRAVAAEPLVHQQFFPIVNQSSLPKPAIDPQRPLRGVRVLDLTRILAGPVAGRFLAAYGAEVLRLDPPHWDEPGVIPEVVLGKRCARLDLKTADGLQHFRELLAQCDVLLHGYRPGALENLGLGAEQRRQLNPALVDVSLNAYGWTGPWSKRRGFDSLVQMSCGIADEGMLAAGADKPMALPVQALDHATGYLLAAAVLSGLQQRRQQRLGSEFRLSLARTAALLVAAGTDYPATAMAAETAVDCSSVIEKTDWGPAQRITFPLRHESIQPAWDYPARQLGSSAADWL